MEHWQRKAEIHTGEIVGALQILESAKIVGRVSVFHKQKRFSPAFRYDSDLQNEIGAGHTNYYLLIKAERPLACGVV